MKLIAKAVLVLGMVVLTGCATTSVREHPQIENHLKRVESVVIAPPVVSVEKVNFTGENERLVEVEDSIRTELVKLAKAGLEQHGFEVIEFDFEQALQEDEDFAYTVTQVREGFDQAKALLYKGGAVYEENKRDVSASVGTAVNMVSERTGADAVMLMHFSGMKKSGGEVAKDIAVSVMLTLLTGSTPISNSEASYVEIAFIDGVTGDVIWSNVNTIAQLSAAVADGALNKLPQDIDPVLASNETGISEISPEPVRVELDAE